MEQVIIEKINEVFLKVRCDASTAYELSEHFSFEVPNAKFQPLVKAGVWDGFVRIFNVNTGRLPIGLYDDLVEFCNARDYELVLTPSSHYGLPNQLTNILPQDLVDFAKSLNIHSRGEPVELRDYQLEAIFKALKYRRRTILSPTGSGKSSIIYTLLRYLLDCDIDVLIVVPTTQLVEQMFRDFKDYSSEVEWSPEGVVHRIYAGKDKNVKLPIVVSTWQSLQTMQAIWFQRFGCVMIDEVQSAKSKQLQSLLEKCGEAYMRFGLTGTLDKSETHQTMIRAMLGPIMRVAKTRELIDKGYLSEIKIKAITLDYNKETKAAMKKADYRSEVSFLTAHERRNKFIRNLALSLEGNTLILYSYVSSHGQLLDDLIREKAGERHVFFIHGKVDVDDREEVGKIMMTHNNAIAIASYGTFQAGINIPELHNIILAFPTKSVVRLLQSLGRGLRVSKGKSHFTLYDIGDKLTASKKNHNHTYNHFVERLNIYTKEQFEYSLIEVDIE